MVVYRIADWDRHFENNRTRQLKHMEWVPVPNKMDGDGYTELLDHPDGAAHFGAWVAIVEVASRCTPRGILVRDIPQEFASIPQEGAAESHPAADGCRTLLRAHDSRSLSRMTRIPAAVFDAAIPRLLAVGWLTSEVVASSTDTQIPQGSAGRTAQSRTRVRDNDYGTERNGTEVLSASADAAKSAGIESRKEPGQGQSDAGKAARKRSPKPNPDPKPEHAEVRAYFCDRWKALRSAAGADYGWKPGKDDKHLKWVLDQCGRNPETARGIIEAFVRDDDPWLADKGHDIGLLVARWNKYRARGPSEPADDADNGFVRKELPPDVLAALVNS